MVISRESSPMLQEEGASSSLAGWMRLLTSCPPADDLADAQEALNNLESPNATSPMSQALWDQCETPVILLV